MNREVGLLSAAISCAEREWGWEIQNPATRRRLREPEGRVYWLRKAEAAALVRAVGKASPPHVCVLVSKIFARDLRYSCAAWLVNAGVALPAVRDLLGHSTVKVTERYAHLVPENIRAAVDALVTRSRFGHVNKKEGKAVAAK